MISRFLMLSMTWRVMLSKERYDTVIITITIKAHVYNEILDTFLIPLRGNVFSDDEPFTNLAKRVKTFPPENHIQSMTWQAKSTDLNLLDCLVGISYGCWLYFAVLQRRHKALKFWGRGRSGLTVLYILRIPS